MLLYFYNNYEFKSCTAKKIKLQFKYFIHNNLPPKVKNYCFTAPNNNLITTTLDTQCQIWTETLLRDYWKGNIYVQTTLTNFKGLNTPHGLLYNLQLSQVETKIFASRAGCHRLKLLIWQTVSFSRPGVVLNGIRKGANTYSPTNLTSLPGSTEPPNWDLQSLKVLYELGTVWTDQTWLGLFV